MRRQRKAQRKEHKINCLVCKRQMCIDEKVPKIICRINPELCSGPVTRSVRKILDYYLNEFIIVESYRCMPLIGGEEYVPNWDVHIVRYEIVYMNKL